MAHPLPEKPELIASWLGQHDAVPSAKMAVETALLDVASRAQGKSLAALLHPQAASHVLVNATLGHLPLRESVRRAKAFTQQGYTCIKLKVGVGAVEEDIERVGAIRQAVGPDVTLRLDANGAWTPQQARDVLMQVAVYGVEMVEQPVADLVGFESFSGIKVAADESIRTLQDAHEHVPWMDVCVLKPMLTGGLLEALKIQESLGKRGISVVYTTLLDGAIARAALVHLAAASMNLGGACGLATGGLLGADVSTSGLLPSQGHLSVPPGPGLGVVPDLIEGYETIWRADATWLPHPLAHRARYVPEGVALCQEGEAPCTWGMLYSQALVAAQKLVDAVGEPPLRVAMYAHNQPHSVAWIHAVGLLGGQLVVIHPGAPPEVARQQVVDAGAQVVLTQQEMVHQGELGLPVLLMDLLLLDEGAPVSLGEYPEVAEHEIAALLYTSGTTGQAKQVPLRWGQVTHSVTGSAVALGHHVEDVWLLSLPLCHVGGLSVVWRCAWLGTTVEVQPSVFTGGCGQEVA